LSHCEFDQCINENRQCEDCLDECTEGCVRFSDCVVCIVEYCAECHTYNECTICKENATLTEDKTCECNVNFFPADDNTCQSCDPACKICTDATIESCSECNTGYALIPDTTICKPDTECPSGFVVNDARCEKPVPDEVTICFTWDSKTIDATDEATGVTVSVSDDTSTHPVNSYKRGIWFDGNDSITVNNLILNTTFTLELWIRAETDGSLLTITTDYADFGISERILDMSHVGDVYPSTIFTPYTWTLVYWKVRSDNSVTICKEEDNTGTQDCTDITLGKQFVDDVTTDHIIGTGYTGHIYQICFHQYEVVTHDIDNPSPCSGSQCVSCPTGVCLFDCAVD